jgi:iron complex outermembrane recepter protein
MRKIIILLTIITLSLAGEAQTGKGRVAGTVIDGNTKTIESATITLLKAKDSSVVKMAVADKNGNYAFENIAEGAYLVAISAVGHNKGFSPIFEVSAANADVKLGTIELIPASKSLTGVTVTARKPLVEQKIDRMIVNVDAAATNVGTSAMEVLEKAPGVSVDKDGNISLKGKQGVQVYIDGRPSYMSGQDLANYLRNMNASQLEQLEIMTNPPAKYDAAGNSGIINIKTKKNKQFGYNGNLTSAYRQGRYPKVSQSLNFNYRKNKVNLFTNVGYSYRKNFQDLDIQRKFLNQTTKQVESHFDQATRITEIGESVNGKIGVDYFATKKTTLGAVVTGFYNPGEFQSRGNIFIADPARVLLSRTFSSSYSDRTWKNLGLNLNFRHQFDSTGRELTIDGDYLSYNSVNTQDLMNYYYTPSGGVLQKADTLLGDLPQKINIYTAKADYVHPLKNEGKFEAGIKTSFVKTDNDGVYNNVFFGKSILDSGRSNHFIYKENVNAAYVNYSRKLSKKWSAQVGLRLENTTSDGDSKGYEYDVTSQKFVYRQRLFKRNYTQLFPTAFFQYTANEKNTFVLNYGRRIERPNYADLNPFVTFLDIYTFEQGNPRLNPQFAHNVELSHTYSGFLTTTLNYSSTNNIITDVLEQDPSRNETYVKKSNIASLKQYGISISAGIPVKKWWEANVWMNLYNNRYKGIVNGDNVSLGATTFQANVSNQFKFKKGWGAELSGFITTPMVEGVFQIGALGQVDIGFSKQILKGKGTLRLSGRDIFLNQKVDGFSRFGIIDAAFQQIRDSRQIGVGFTYRFNKGTAKANGGRRSGGATDEQNRVKTGN